MSIVAVTKMVAAVGAAGAIAGIRALALYWEALWPMAVALTGLNVVPTRLPTGKVKFIVQKGTKSDSRVLFDYPL